MKFNFLMQFYFLTQLVRDCMMKLSFTMQCKTEASNTGLKGTDMKTLTRFFNASFADHTHTHTQTNLEAGMENGIYEIIENETLENRVLENLNLSGSLITYTTFKSVTFKSCVFFGSKIENCTFINCKFIDCKFSFSHVDYCDFRASSFNSIVWDFSPISKCNFSFCALDTHTAYFSSSEGNSLASCYASVAIEDEGAVAGDEKSYNVLQTIFNKLKLA